MIVKNELPPVVIDRPVSVDIEIFGMSDRLHRPTGAFASMQVGVGDEVYVVLEQDKLQEAWDNIKNAEHIIMHNALFDIRHLRRWITIEERPIWDVMLVEQVLWGGYYNVGEFALADLCRRYLNEYMDKGVRDDFITASHMTREMYEYAAKDAYVTMRVHLKQADEIRKRGYDMRVYWELDAPSIWTVLDMKPIKVNSGRWLEMAGEFADKGAQIEAEIGVNVNSWKRVLDYVQRVSGVRLKDTKADTLLAYKDKIPEINNILTARMYRKASSTYGEKWVQKYVEDDDFVYSNFNINGTETGRASCVVGDTLLETTSGTFKIRDLDLQKYRKCGIMSHTGKTREITNWFYQGKLPCFEVVTSDGGYIRCSYNHRILTPDGWKEVHELSKGCKVSSSILVFGRANNGEKKVPDGRKFRSVIFGGAAHGGRAHRNRSGQQGFVAIGESALSEICGANREGEIYSQIRGSGSEGARGIRKGRKIKYDYIRQGHSRIHGVDGDVRVFNGGEAWSRTTNCPQESSEIQDEDTMQKVAEYERKRHGDSSENRDIVSRSSRGILRLSEKPARFLQKIVSRICRGTKDFVVHKGNILKARLLSGHWEDSERSHLLDSKPRGGNPVNGTVEREHPAPEILSLCEGYWKELYGRLLFPELQFAGGSGWFNTRGREFEEIGRKEGECNEATRLQVAAGNVGGSDKGYGQDSFGNKIAVVESIRYIGVKDTYDISIDKDCSYVAGGVINHNSTSPNLLNIPARRIPEYRELFVNSKGRMIVADISQQEPRILAFLSNDKNLKQAFDNKDDIHLFVTRKIFDDPTIEKSDKRRAIGKMINLATSYGMTAKGLASRLNIDEKEAEQFLNMYFSRFPDVSNFIQRQRLYASRNEYVDTIMGRKVWINSHNFQWENNAINSPIQGSAADFAKLWVNKFRELCINDGLEFPVCIVVYDEVVMDVSAKNEKRYVHLLQDAFDWSGDKMLPGMPIALDIETGISWACKTIDEDEEDIIVEEE